MSKKFTMLLASLFLTIGTAWAQMPEVGKEYRIKDDKSERYLTIRSYNGTSGSGTHGTVPLLEKAQINADQVWVLETAENNTYYLKSKSGYYLKCRGWNVDALNGGDKSAVSLETPTVDYLNGLTLPAYNEGTSFCIKNGDLYFKSQSVGGDGGTAHPFCNCQTNNDWGNRTTWTFEEVPADEFKAEVALTLVYNYGGKQVSTEVVEKIPGSNFALPVPDYTKIASCKVGEEAQTVTDGACSIVVPDAEATITVELASDLPFEVSVDYDHATWYALQIRDSHNVVMKDDKFVNSDAPTTATDASLWAFMGNPFDGIQVLNKAAGKGFTLSANVKMEQEDTPMSWNILPNGNGFTLRNGTSGYNCLNDLSTGLGYWDDSRSPTDAGSRFIVVSEAEMITKATAALNTVQTRVNKNVAAAGQITDASYYAYSKTAVAEAKTQLESIETPTTILAALQVIVGSETMLGNLEATMKSPKVGDYIRFKNRAYPVFLATTDNADNVIRKSDNADDLKALWLVKTGSNGSVLLQNVGTEKYVGNIAQSTDVTQVEENAAAQLTFSNLENDIYGRFQKTNGGTYSFANMNEWAGSYQLKGWMAGEDNHGSHWLMTQAYPLTVVFNYKGEEVTEQSIKTYVDCGDTYTITNPYANKYVNVTCVVNGNRVEAVDGQWTVNVSQATSVIVTITEDLPFKTSTSFATANWQYLQMNSSAWKYMQKNENDNNTSSVGVGSLSDRALWAFVGDALNGFQIWNKAHEGAVLTVDAVDDGTAAYMKASGDQKWTIEKGNGGFIIRQGAKECLNDHAGGGVMKIWNADASPTGAGSAFRTISASVTDLADLCFPGVFTLQAERSPLLYDASANVADANKLSSGMASGIAANGNDANQQFLISESETDGLYYLYSVGAAKFVDAELNFTDYPQPVLSFESNAGNPVFPWFVKIGGKYVVPGTNGTAGNKLYHTETPEADAGKRYRIEKVGEDMSLTQSVALTIQYAAGLIKGASQLDNGKVYAVYTYDRGAWCYNGDDALWSTYKPAEPAGAVENADKFAFLTVNGKIYLYSIGAGKFVVKSETAGSLKGENTWMYYATYSDTPTQTVELLPATNGNWFPIVVKLNVDGPNQLNITNEYSYPIIFWNDQADAGNQVRIEEIGTLNLSAVVAQIEAYQMDEEAKGGLQTLITEATTKNTYLENASLTDAITAAQAALDKVGATYDELMTAKENLAAALNSALYVTEIDGFSNNYVYTFVSKRGWMGANATDGVISGTGADDNANYQWAVYKSSEHYYLYNIGKGQFMGVEIRDKTQMPFSATPQTTGLTFKKSAWADYPIMFSMDNQNVVNNDKNGKMICWTGGWNTTNDDGSNHKVTVVGKIEEETLSIIAAAVELYETQGVAVQALDAAIAAAQAKVDGIGAGLGYYSTTEVEAAATLAAIVEFKNAIMGETTVAAIEAQTAAANALVKTFSVNLPEAGKFYRVKNNGGTGYLNGKGTSGRAKFDGGENDANSVFYYVDGKLLSYKTGTYLAAKIPSGKNANFLCYTEELNVGTDITFKESPALGKLLIVFDNESRSFYSANTGESDAAPAGNNGENYRFTVEEVSDLPVAISDASVNFNEETKCVSTLFAPVALEVPTGIAAYIGVNEDNYLAMKPIEAEEGAEKKAIIPANTGVILMADEAGTYDFEISAAAGTAIAAGKNIITGTVAKSIITPADNTTYYVLANGNNGVGLYKAKMNRYDNGDKVPTDKEDGTRFLNNAFKAYIPVETPAEQAPPALVMRLGRGSQGGATSIESSELNAQGAQLIYDLQGRRVLNPTKGMYIVNGKKMVIK